MMKKLITISDSPCRTLSAESQAYIKKFKHVDKNLTAFVQRTSVEALPSGDALSRFVATRDLKDHLPLLKKVINRISNNLQPQLCTDHLCKAEAANLDVMVLVDVFFNLSARSPLRKAVISSLQSLSEQSLPVIDHHLQNVIVTSLGHVLNAEASVSQLQVFRNLVDRLTASLDTVPIGEKCVVKCSLSVFQFNAEILKQYINEICSGLSPVERTARMSDLLAVVQLNSRLLQKVGTARSSSAELLAPEASLDRLSCSTELRQCLQTIISCYCHILCDGTFISDCVNTAAMGLITVVKFMLPEEQLVDAVRKILFKRSNEPQELILSDCIVEKKPSSVGDGTVTSLYVNLSSVHGLPIESRVCLLGAVLAILNKDSLVCVSNEHDVTFLSSVARELLDLAEQLQTAATNLIYSRTLSLLVNKTRAALETDAISDGYSFLCKEWHGHSAIPQQITQYSWTRWDDPIDVIRHQSRIIFEQIVHCHLLASKEDPVHSGFLRETASSLLSLDWSARTKYGPLCCLVQWLGASSLLESCPQLPQATLTAMADQSVACHVGELLGNLYVSHWSELSAKVSDELASCQSPGDLWCMTWVDPVLNIVMSASEVHQSLILEYVARRLIKTFPATVNYIADRLTSANCGSNSGVLRTLIACHKYLQVSGMLQSAKSAVEFTELHPGLLKWALHHSDDQVRLDALGLFCEHHKTTAPINAQDFDQIKFFLVYNMDSQSPSFRQSLVALLKKLLSRLLDSGRVLNRQRLACNNTQENGTENECSGSKGNRDIVQQLESYKDFLNWVTNFCFKALHPAACFPSRTTSLAILSMFVRIVGVADLTDCGLEFSFCRAVDSDQELSLVECLMDTFEQNKQEALSILSAIPVSESHLQGNDSEIGSFIDVALQLAQSTRPQDGVTAAYLLRWLLRYPQTKATLYQLCHDYETDIRNEQLRWDSINGDEMQHAQHLCCELLLTLVCRQLDEARVNLLKVAATRPLYPTLLCVRHILSSTSFRNVSVSGKKKWRQLLAKLITTCFYVAEVVMPIVSNSCPEGNIPEEIAINKTEGGIDCSQWINELTAGNSEASQDAEDVTAKVQLMPEYLVVCGWRSIKEVSLLLGHVTSSLPVCVAESEESDYLLTVDQLKQIGAYFTKQLLESRHRGAFELAYTGFVQMTEMLWQSPIAEVHCLPQHWLDNLMAEVRVHDPEDRLCSTRRSAGIPFFVQALVTTEPVSVGRNCFHGVMTETLQLASQPTTFENTAKIHSLNILRALFRDTRLGEDVFPFIAEGIKIALCNYSSTYWPVRNSATLLFSALMTRIFGVKKSKGFSASRTDLMTGRVFFNRFPTLFEYFSGELAAATAVCREESNRMKLNPGLYPLLIVLGQLCPSVAEGANSSLRIEELIPFIIRCAASPVYKIRLMAARAIRTLVSAEQFVSVLATLFDNADLKGTVTQNQIHGSLLQIRELLKEVRKLNVSNQATVYILIMSRLPGLICLNDRRNRCLVTRAAFVNVVTAAHTLRWPPVETNHLTTHSYDNFKASLFETATNYLAVDDHLRACNNIHVWQPFYVTFLSETARLLLLQGYGRKPVDVTKLAQTLFLLLRSKVYELRLLGLRFIARVCCKDYVDVDCEDCDSAVEEILSADLDEHVKSLLVCHFDEHERDGSVLKLLFRMLAETEHHDECLSTLLNILAECQQFCDSELLSAALSETCFKNASVLLERLLCLVNTHPREIVKCSAMHYSGRIFSKCYDSVALNVNRENNDELLLKSFCAAIETSSHSLVPTDMRSASCGILVRNADVLLFDAMCLLGGCHYAMWSTLVRLLQDEDAAIRQCAAQSAECIAHKVQSSDLGSSARDIHPRIALDFCLRSFVELHNKEILSWKHGGIQQILDWLVHSIDPGWQEQEHNVRLFDRGDLNSYRDDLDFVFSVIRSAKKATFRIGRDTDEPTFSHFFSVLTDVVDDVKRVGRAECLKTNSAKFDPQQQKPSVENVLDLYRKLAAVDWLRQILDVADADLSLDLVDLKPFQKRIAWCSE